jgi:hypothetical protein
LSFNLRRRGYPAIVSLPPDFRGANIGTLLAVRDLVNERRFDEVLYRIHPGAAPE